MKVLVPTPVQPANYAAYPATNGYANFGDYAPWNIATAYTTGQFVIVDALKSVFICIANTTGTAPTLTMTTPWLRVGASNAWKPFDAVVSSQAPGYTFGDQAADLMRYRLTGMGGFTTVAVLATDASSVTVKFTDRTGAVTYNTKIKAVDVTPVIDAWTYAFSDLNVQRDFIFDGIDGWGLTSADILDITISNDGTGTPVLVGEIVVGEAWDLGVNHADAKMRLVDYSAKKTSVYGDVTLTKRAFSYHGSFDIEIPSTRRNRVQGLVNALRATNCVWFPTAADANQGIVLYGWHTDFEITYETPERAYATLEIEGLT